MLGGGVSEYAAIHARVRAMYSSLLTPQMWARLSEVTDVTALIGSLKDTAYGPYLMRVEEENLTPQAGCLSDQRQGGRRLHHRDPIGPWAHPPAAHSALPAF